MFRLIVPALAAVFVVAAAIYLINAFATGEIRRRGGVIIRREAAPIAYWLGLATILMSALFIGAIFVPMLLAAA